MLKMRKEVNNKIKIIMYIFATFNLFLVFIGLVILVVLYTKGVLEMGVSYNVSNIVIIGFVLISLTIFNLLLYNIYIYIYISHILSC